MQALAAFVFEGTSAKAVGASLRTAVDTVIALEDALVFGVFAQLQARREEIEGAPELVARVAQALRRTSSTDKPIAAPRARRGGPTSARAEAQPRGGRRIDRQRHFDEPDEDDRRGFSYQSLQGSTRDEAIASLDSRSRRSALSLRRPA